jgi:hypothetical protein
MKTELQRCPICDCLLHREGHYGEPSAHGRSHATSHHYVAERFFGRSKNRRGEIREAIFPECPWDCEKRTVVLCYECHEELIHNPVFLPSDIERFGALVRSRALCEGRKSDDRTKIQARIKLLREVIDAGLSSLGKHEIATNAGRLLLFPRERVSR